MRSTHRNCAPPGLVADARPSAAQCRKGLAVVAAVARPAKIVPARGRPIEHGHKAAGRIVHQVEPAATAGGQPEGDLLGLVTVDITDRGPNLTTRRALVVALPGK